LMLYEYEAREILSRYGVPVEPALLAKSPDEAEEAARRIPPPYVVKAQILATGRGRAGGVVAVDTPEEVRRIAARLLNTKIRDLPVKAVLVAHRVEIVRELYLSIMLDRGSGLPLIIASRLGGMSVEEAARQHPESVLRVPVDPFVGLRSYIVMRIAKHLGLSPTELGRVLRPMFRVFEEYHCLLVEVNPLAETPEGLVAVDRRIIVDESAAPVSSNVREVVEKRASELEGPELEAKRWGFSYVPLDGEVGVIGNGAGLTMATMDLVRAYGGRPACFLDIGGGASRDRVKAAIKVLLSDPRVKVILVNVLGGITRCDEVALGIVEALREAGQVKPLVVRLAGTLEEEGRTILSKAGIEALASMSEAAKRAVEVSLRGGTCR